MYSLRKTDSERCKSCISLLKFIKMYNMLQNIETTKIVNHLSALSLDTEVWRLR